MNFLIEALVRRSWSRLLLAVDECARITSKLNRFGSIMFSLEIAISVEPELTWSRSMKRNKKFGFKPTRNTSIPDDFKVDLGCSLAINSQLSSHHKPTRFHIYLRISFVSRRKNFSRYFLLDCSYIISICAIHPDSSIFKREEKDYLRHSYSSAEDVS